MGPGHQPVQVHPAQVVFCQDDHMVGGHFHDGRILRLVKDVQIVQGLHTMLFF